MVSYPNLLVVDLSSYGSALAIINQFCDDDHVKVFEISPVGQTGLLILLIKDETAAEILKNEILSFYKANIFSLSLIKNFNDLLLKAYLSQNKNEVLSNLLIQEFSFVSQAFQAAQELLSQSAQVIDFRVIRTSPLNAIVISTAPEVKQLIQMKNLITSRTSVVIEKVEKTLRQYF